MREQEAANAARPMMQATRHKHKHGADSAVCQAEQ
jgi:hypothetical protein